MYKPGDIRLITPPCETMDEDRYCDEYGVHTHRVMDSRDDSKVWTLGAFLPHSCDEWVIGGAEQIRQMIRDLEAALKEIEGQGASK